MTKKTVEAPASTPIQRTSAGLRDAIFDEIDSVRNGSSNPKLATGIVETVRMEIEVQRHLKQNAGTAQIQAQVTDMGVPLQLGKAA